MKNKEITLNNNVKENDIKIYDKFVSIMGIAGLMLGGLQSDNIFFIGATVYGTLKAVEVIDNKISHSIQKSAFLTIAGCASMYALSKILPEQSLLENVLYTPAMLAAVGGGAGLFTIIIDGIKQSKEKNKVKL